MRWPAEFLGTAVKISADFVMKLGRAHRPGEDLVADQLAIEGVGIEQGLVVEDDVVDADDVVLP